MTAFPPNDSTSLSTRNETATQIHQVRHLIDEATRDLAVVRKKRISAEDVLVKCTKETKQRVALLMENGEVIDGLHQLDYLLKEEKNLREQLNGPSLKERDLWKDLQERNECITNKAKSLSAEIVEVRRKLEEAVAYSKAAQSSVPESTSKSKRKQTKAK